MARLNQTPITQKDIRDYLATTEDEFRLELETYNACITAGLEASHGGTYEDSITKKTRQYDIRASREKDCRRVQLAVECKCLKTFFPLLIYQTTRTDDETYQEIIFSCKSSTRINYGLPPNLASSEKFSGKYSMYREIPFVGKSTVQVGKNINSGEFTGDDSEVFDKWSQALSSAHDLIAESVNYQERYSSRWYFTITLPVLVVSDETLWVVNYSREGVQESVPKKADQAVIYIGKDYSTDTKEVSYTISYLHVFTLNAFKKYVQRLVADDDPNEYIWDEFFPYDKLSKLKSENS